MLDVLSESVRKEELLGKNYLKMIWGYRQRKRPKLQIRKMGLQEALERKGLEIAYKTNGIVCIRLDMAEA